MFKFVILTLVAIWILGLFLGKKRRMIKDVHQLLGFIIFAALAFVGLTMFSDMPALEASVVLHLLATIAWLGLSWAVSRLILKYILR